MNRMKKTAGLVVALTLTAGCVPAPYRMGRFPGPYVPVHPYMRPAPPDAASAVGRWDNVMLLEAGTPLQVLMKSGRKESGSFASADATMLRVVTTTSAGTVELPQADVMRVDRVPGAADQEYGEAAARGAAVGVGVVGLMGLVAGHMPPARLFAAGALAGAAKSAGATWAVRTPVTIYLATEERRSR